MFPNRWDPFRDLSKELTQLHQEMDDMFRKTFGLNREVNYGGTGMEGPAINTFVKDQQFYVEIEVPGIEKDQLDVSVDGNMLTISGERKSGREIKEHEYLLRETHFGSFRRRLMLPEGVDAEKIQANCKDGILEIRMPMEKKCIGGRKVVIEGAGTGEAKKME